MPQTWHFSYTAVPLQPFALQTSLVKGSPCLTHPPSLVWSIACYCSCNIQYSSCTWIVQDPLPSLTVPQKIQSAASPQLPSLLWGHGHEQHRERKKGIQCSLTFCFTAHGASLLLKLFPVPKILSQVMMTNSVSLTHRERKYTLLYISSMCWTSFIPEGHELYSNEQNTELFCRMHP